MSDTTGAPNLVDRDAAIDMAVHTGNWLFTHRDDRHFWAMTLIISNLFELAGDSSETQDSFDKEFYEIVQIAPDRSVALGWDIGCIARAVRNIIAHGMSLDRTQRKSFKSRDRVEVVSIGYLSESIDQEGDFIYDVTLIGEGQYIIHFSPDVFWPYVQEWYKTRNLR